MRYYYKSADGKGLLSLKSPITEEDEDQDLIEITEEEFNRLTVAIELGQGE